MDSVKDYDYKDEVIEIKIKGCFSNKKILASISHLEVMINNLKSVLINNGHYGRK